MTPQLHSIEHAPLHLPYWHAMMDDLCQPPAARVARVLGLSVRSIHRYNATGYAPRHVCLAVFWLTRWGRSAVHAQATNDALLMAGYVGSLERRSQELCAQVERLLSIGDFGSANAASITPQRSASHALALAPEFDPRPPHRADGFAAVLADLPRLHTTRRDAPDGQT